MSLLQTSLKIIGISIVWLIIGASPAWSANFESIALSGDGAVGTQGGVLNAFWGLPTINDVGQVAFRGQLQDGVGDATDTNSNGIWSDGSGSMQLIVRQAFELTSEFVGHNVKALSRPYINNQGHVAFQADVTHAILGDSAGIWSNRSGTVEVVARTSSTAPGTGLLGFQTIRGLALNNNGNIAYSGTINGDADGNGLPDFGIWIDGRLVAREGMPIPIGENAVYRRLSGGQELVLSDQKEIAITALYINDSVFFSGDLLAVDGPSGFRTISESNNNNGGGPNRSAPHSASINNSGQVAFNFTHFTGGIDTVNSPSFITDPFDSPGGVPGSYFNEFHFGPHVINSQGKVAFSANLLHSSGSVDETNDSGIWMEPVTDPTSGQLHSPSDLLLVAREGDQAEGVAAGATFNDLAHTSVVLNSAGQLAFAATFTLGEVTDNNGIWVFDSVTNSLELVAGTGSLIEVAPGDVRTVLNIGDIDDFDDSFSGGEDGRASYLADNGDVVFRAQFTDGSQGVFVAAMQNPEPGTIQIGILLGTMLLSRRVRSSRI